MALKSREMATVAEQLRQARETAGLTVHQVAESTKMRTDHVRALESGDYDVFVAPVYIRGFVRTYARLLRLDESAVMTTLDEELGRSEKFREHPSLTGQEKSPLDLVMLQLSRINWRIVLPVALVLAVAAISLWIGQTVRNRRVQDPVEGIEPVYYEPKQPVSGETLPLPAPPGNRR